MEEALTDEAVQGVRAPRQARRKGKRATKVVPYASASAGTKAREEITKLLRSLGCESVGFMDEWDKHEVLLAFTHRGRNVQLRASAKGWAAFYLRKHPWTYQRHA